MAPVAHALVLLLFLCPALALARQDGSSDGKIRFAPLPPSNNSGGGLPVAQASPMDGYYFLPHSFIDAVLPGPLPYDVISGPIVSLVCGGSDCSGGNQTAVQSTVADTQTTLKQIANPLLRWLIPLLVTAALGLVMALLLSVIGCCFCCCRLCGRCGGEAHRYKRKRHVSLCSASLIILFLSNAMILAGASVGFVSNDHISSSIEDSNNTATAVMDTAVQYIYDTVDEILFIADEHVQQTIRAVHSDITDIGSVLGDPLTQTLMSYTSPLLDNITDLIDEIENVQQVAQTVNSTLEDLRSLSSDLQSNVSVLQSAVANLSNCCMACSLPASSDIDVAFDWNNVSGLGLVLMGEVDTAKDIVATIAQNLSNVPTLLEEEVRKLDVDSTIAEVVNSIANITREVNSTVDELFGSNGTIADIKEKVLVYSGYVEKYDIYRYAVVAVLLVVIVIIVVMFLMAILCGVFGYSNKAMPNERSSVSHCGSFLILIAVVLCFLTGGLFLFLTTISFVIATGLQRVCSDLSSPSYVGFAQLLDNTDLWGGHTLVGYITGRGLSSLQIDGLPRSLDIEVVQALKSCEENVALWSGLQLDSLVDLSALLSNLTQIGFVDEFDFENSINSAVNLSELFEVPDDFSNTLTDITGSVMSSLNLTEYEGYLGTSILTFDVDELVQNLTTSQMTLPVAVLGMVCSPSGETVDAMIDTITNEAVKINDTLHAELSSLLSHLQGNLSILEMEIQNTSSLQKLSMDILSASDALSEQAAPIITNEIECYVTRLLGYVDQFLNHTVDVISREVGLCRPVAAVYRTVHIAVCNEFLNGLNGLWFSLGWCVLFFVSAIISGVIATVFLRRSPEPIKALSENDYEVYANNGVELTHINRTQNQPSRMYLPHVPVHEW